MNQSSMDENESSDKNKNNNSGAGGGGSGSSSGSCRWNPTKEQIGMLENLYKQGIRTPSAEQIQQITARLRAYGHIEGKNVFYWFQNHKARQRQKHKQETLAYFNRFLPPPPILSSPNGIIHLFIPLLSYYIYLLLYYNSNYLYHSFFIFGFQCFVLRITCQCHSVIWGFILNITILLCRRDHLA